MKVKENPDLWDDILNDLKNSWPQISGSILAIAICYGRLIYDGVERKNGEQPYSVETFRTAFELL